MNETGNRNTVICTYRVKPGEEGAFAALLADHWPILDRHGLVADEPPRHYRTEDDDGPVFVEIFTWRDGAAAGTAHAIPDVADVWNRMETLVEDRGGKPKWDFPHFERFTP